MRLVTQEMALAHLRKASNSAEPKRRRSVLYFIGGDNGPVKIGYSCNLSKRLAAIQAHCPVPVRVLASIHNGQGRQQEIIYHNRFARHRLHGEWFERCPEIEAEIARLSEPHSCRNLSGDGR